VIFSLAIKGAKPLFLFLPPHDRNIYLYHGESKGDEASFIQLIPLPLIKGKGIKGIGLPIKI